MTSISRKCISFCDEADSQFDKPIVIKNLPYCITLCLVSALVWTWSISWVPPLLGNRPQDSGLSKFDSSNLPDSSVIVDCDGLVVSVYRYDDEKSPELILHETSFKSVEINMIDKLNVLTEMNNIEMLYPIWNLIDNSLNRKNHKEGFDNIFIGVSGELTESILENKIPLSQLDTFERILRSRYEKTSTLYFENLSPDRQGHFELKAVRFGYNSHLVFKSPSPHSSNGIDEFPASLSCGWESCQLVSGDTSHIVQTFETDIQEAQMIAASVGQASAFDWWDEHIRTNLAKMMMKSNPSSSSTSSSKYLGNIIGITMVSSAAEYVGLDSNRAMTVDEALSTCTLFLEQIHYSDVIGIDFITRLSIKRLSLILEELLDKKSLIYFARDSRLTVAWPLGAAISYPWNQKK
mmetsp:Transcript_12070/g.15559  ORF Transcript_12070/g.15559 Transcript_12070/m.15559 type:complete len:407 (-) Transcript_12070:324-1544(-)